MSEPQEEGRVVPEEAGPLGRGHASRDAPAASTDRRLLVYEPEYESLLNVAQRSGSTLSPVLRQAWDGNRLESRTRRRVSKASNAPSL